MTGATYGERNNTKIYKHHDSRLLDLDADLLDAQKQEGDADGSRHRAPAEGVPQRERQEDLTQKAQQCFGIRSKSFLPAADSG